MKWHDMKWNDMKWYEMKWYEMIWNEMIWHEMKWHEMKWYDMTWNDMKWNGMKWYEMKWYDMKWHEMTWNDMISYDMTWNDMKWYEMIRRTRCKKLVLSIRVLIKAQMPSLRPLEATVEDAETQLCQNLEGFLVSNQQLERPKSWLFLFYNRSFMDDYQLQRTATVTVQHHIIASIKTITSVL